MQVILPIRALNCIAVARCLSITKPIPDAVEFFQWFVTRMIAHTRKVAFENGADWSADKTWYCYLTNLNKILMQSGDF